MKPKREIRIYWSKEDVDEFLIYGKVYGYTLIAMELIVLAVWFVSRLL